VENHIKLINMTQNLSETHWSFRYSSFCTSSITCDATKIKADNFDSFKGSLSVL